MIVRVFSLILAALLVGAPAYGAPLARAQTEYVDSTLYAERAGLVPGETTWFALNQNVRDGWHVFWVNPGDAGLPLMLDWSLPSGFEAGAVIHPAPEYIPVGPLASYAHEGAPTFLIPVTAPANAIVGDTVDVAINASWQACEDICVPEDARYEFSLPVLAAEDAPAEENGIRFAAARLALPETLSMAAEFRRTSDRYELNFGEWPDGLIDGGSIDGAFFFPADEGLTTPAAAQNARIANGGLVIEMTPGWIDGPPGETVRGVLDIGDGVDRRVFEIEASVAPGIASVAATSMSPTVPAGNVFVLLALAFFGGLILNAMPCVFPILFVKAASLLASAQHAPGVARTHGALYGAGVVSAFLAIGVLLLVLRAGGEQLGWGFHLQSPAVIGVSAYILFLVGLSLAGVFSVGEGLAGAGDSLTKKPGATGAFFTGVLAVAVAAPCIGPLLTAPMAAALTQPAPVSLSIFFTMALGLAAPFVAVTFVPGLGRLLPRPGPWMAVFKQVLAFPVFAAAAYFVWVFARQTGDAALGGLLGGLVLLAFAAWAFELGKGEGLRALFVRGLSAFAIVLALSPAFNARPVAEAADVERYGALRVEPFSASAIEVYRREGRPVFTIFTAAWCVTCQADKLTIFSSDSLAEAFERENGVVMVADWTLRDPAITDALGRLGAVGVPFYAVYAPDGAVTPMPPPISKQQIITQFRGL